MFQTWLFPYCIFAFICFAAITRRQSLSRKVESPVPIKHLTARQAPGVIATSDFLRRAHQTSAVAGNWVYIDGGEFSYMTSNSTAIFQYSSTLLSIDLSQSWNNATVTIHSTNKPDGAPNLNEASFWYHKQEGLFYSGFAGWNSDFGDDPALPPLSLWTFKPDGTGSGIWNEAIGSNSSVWDSMKRPSSSLMAYDSDSAWALGGTDVPSELPDPKSLLQGIVQFNMSSRSFRNTTVKTYDSVHGVASGAMHYVPSFGPEGLFVVMGGSNGNSTTTGFIGLIDFGTVSVFDPAKQEWWNQTTTGRWPSPRIDFCTAGINSTNGTYEIFVYAGWDTVFGPSSIPLDTINILTLPAFHWISVPYNPQNPRHGLSCNAVGGSQILTIGGVDTNANPTDGAPDAAKKSAFDSAPDPFAQGLAIFDMTTLKFSDQYTAGAPPYEQSQAVKQFYSQSQEYNVQNLNAGVAALLQVTYFTNSSSTTSASPSLPSSSSIAPSTPAPPSTHLPSPTSPSISSHISPSQIGGISGGAAGVVAILAILAAVILGAIKCRKAHQNQQSAAISDAQQFEAPWPEVYSVYEMHGVERPTELNEGGTQEMDDTGLRELG